METDDVDRSQVPEGHYANYVEIAHNAREFVFDFGQVWVGSKPGRLWVRVITGPETAEAIYGLLRDALAEYGSKFGEIPQDPK